MLKRIIATSLVLIMALTTLLLTGCGNEEGASKDNIKVGFVLLGSVKDGGWTEAHANGIELLKKETGVETIYKEDVKETPEDTKNAINELIDQGCNVIFAASYGFMDATFEASKEHPDIKFFHCSGDKLSDNHSNYFGKMYEPRYLSGIVAGLKTKSNKLGYVGAFPLPEVISGIDAFTLGAQSVNPNVTVKVRWINSWYDPGKEKAAAEALLNDGCDVITQHSDTTGPQLAAEAKGVWAIGYDLDNSQAAPKAYMTAPIWNWGKYYVDQVNAIKNGTWKAEASHGGLKEGIVALAPLTSVAPAEAQAKVDAVKQQMIDGKFDVFKGPITDNTGKVVLEEGKVMTYEEIMKMTWLVQGVEAKEQK